MFRSKHFGLLIVFVNLSFFKNRCYNKKFFRIEFKLLVFKVRSKVFRLLGYENLGESHLRILALFS